MKHVKLQNRTQSRAQSITATAGVIFFFLLLGVVGRLNGEAISFVHGIVLSTVYLVGFGTCSRIYLHLSKKNTIVRNYKQRRVHVHVNKVFDSMAA